MIFTTTHPLNRPLMNSKRFRDETKTGEFLASPVQQTYIMNQNTASLL